MTDIADVRPGDKVRAVYKDGDRGVIEITGVAYEVGLLNQSLFVGGHLLHPSERLVSVEVLEPAPPPEPDDDTLVRDSDGCTWRKTESGWQGGSNNFLSSPLDWPSLLKRRPLDLYRHAGRIEP